MTFGSNSTVEFGRTNNQNINGIVPANGTGYATINPINYANLILSGSGIKTVRSNLTVNKSLTIASGVTMVIPTGVTLTMATDAQLINNGTIINNGTFTTNSAITVDAAGTLQLNDGAVLDGSGAISFANGATLAFNKSSATIIDGTENYWPASSGPTNISVLQNTVTLNANKSITGASVASGATLAVNGNKQLTVSTLTNNGTVTLKSDANGTATLIPETITGTGTFNVEQYLATTRNWYVSSPVSNANAPSGYTYYGRHEPGGTETGWTAVSAGAGLIAGKGYIALPGTAGLSITFSTQSGGSLNNGDVTVNLTYTPSATSGKGYNLIGNPYTSHLSWTNAFTQANSTKIESSIWYRTNSSGSNASGWSFVTFNLTTAETVPSTVNGGIIPPMQAFWVLAKETGSIQFTNTMRSHQTGNLLKAPAAKNLDRKKVRIQVSNGNTTDEALIVFDANALDGYDAYDSQKMMNNVADIADIYTVTDTKKLVINGMNSVKYNTEIPLGFGTAKAGDFSISVSEFSNFEAGTRVILIDKNYPAVETELALETAYNFYAPITQATTNRFSLLFRAPGASTGVNNTSKASAQVFVNAANQITIIAAEKSNYSIYNAVGQLIENGILSYKLYTTNYKLNIGVYIVKLTENGNELTTRVMVK